MPTNSSPSLNLFGTRKTKQQQNSEAILNSHPDDRLSLPERKLLNQMDSYEGMTVVWSSFLWRSILCICVQTEKAILQFQPPRVLKETTLGREGQGIPVWWGRKVLRRRLVRIRKQHIRTSMPFLPFISNHLLFFSLRHGADWQSVKGHDSAQNKHRQAHLHSINRVNA